MNQGQRKFLIDNKPEHLKETDNYVQKKFLEAEIERKTKENVANSRGFESKKK